MRYRWPATAAWLAATLCATAAAAADGDAPTATRPLRLLVPHQAGGGTDLLAQLLAPPLARALQQATLVQNIPGAGGAVAVSTLLHEPADGKTLLVTASSHIVLAPLLNPAIGFASRDLQPVALLHRDSVSILASTRGRVRSLSDLRTASPDDPPVRVGFMGIGSAGHLLALRLQQDWGRSFIEVPYQGTAPALRDLAAHDLEALVLTTSSAAGRIADGTVLGLGVSDAQRRPCLPQVPTLREQGLPMVWESWSGVLAPAGLPEATAQRLNRAVNQVLALPEVQQVLQRQCLQALPASPGAFDALLRTSVEQARAEVAPFLPRLAVRP